MTACADGQLPDFLIIGAMKSGTSSLHRYLGSHPDVFASNKKELNFFKFPGGDVDDYAANFADAAGAKAVGESSPNYMKLHQFPGTADRIADVLPGVRLICVLRNPIDRIVSHYNHNERQGRERRPFADAIRSDAKYLMTSRYSWQLSHYLKRFDRDQLYVVTAEDLREHRSSAVAGALRFLSVDETGPVDVEETYHVTQSMNSSVDLTDQTRCQLLEQLDSDLRNLRSIVGSNFHCWGLL